MVLRELTPQGITAGSPSYLWVGPMDIFGFYISPVGHGGGGCTPAAAVCL